MRKALATEFSKREHLHVTDFEPDRLTPSQRDIYNETLLLYELVSGAIVRHAFNVQYAPHQHGLSPFFPEKARDFTFSLGKELSDLASDVDAYVIVLGFDQRSSAGRKALGVGRTLIAAALGVVAVPQGGGNLLLQHSSMPRPATSCGLRKLRSPMTYESLKKPPNLPWNS